MSIPTLATSVSSPRKQDNCVSSRTVDMKNYDSPRLGSVDSTRSSPRISPKFKQGELKSAINLSLNSPLNQRKQIGSVMSPDITRKKCVSFNEEVDERPISSTRLPPIVSTGKNKSKRTGTLEMGNDLNDLIEGDNVRLPLRRPLPGTSDIFKQALDELDEADPTVTADTSNFPGDLHVRRSSLILAMSELQLSSLREKFGKGTDDCNNDIDEEDAEIDESPKEPTSPTSRASPGKQVPTNEKNRVEQKPSPRVRKVSAPSKINTSPKMAWKIADSSPRASPQNSPMIKRRAQSVTSAPKPSELNTSRYRERRGTETTETELPKLPVEPLNLTPNSSPRLNRPKISSTLKDMQTITKYIQQASVGAGIQSTPQNLFGFYNDNNSQVLSPRQMLVRRGLTSGKGRGWIQDGLGDITEVTTFDELKGCRYIRRRRSSTYNEI